MMSKKSKITRRDFINGTLMAAGASMLPFGLTSGAILDKLYPMYYPPSLTLMLEHGIGNQIGAQLLN